MQFNNHSIVNQKLAERQTNLYASGLGMLKGHSNPKSKTSIHSYTARQTKAPIMMINHQSDLRCTFDKCDIPSYSQNIVYEKMQDKNQAIENFNYETPA